MRTLLFAALAAMALATPAMAQSRCDALLAEWQRIPDRLKDRAVNEHVERANDALRRGDEAVCREHMNDAFDMLEAGSGSSTEERAYENERRYPEDRRPGEGSGGGIGDIIQRGLGTMGR
jgi:hypothetical protein